MKRKLLFLTTMIVSAFAWNAKAQTDVTSTYLTNADFEASTAIDNHLCGYGKDMANNGTTYYGLQPVDGWTSVVVNGDNSNASYPNSGMGGAVFAYGSSYQMKGNSKTAPATGPDASSTNALGFFGVWGLGGYYYQDVTFPAGEYTINIPVYNQSGNSATTTYFGFYPNSGTSQTMATPTTTGSWVTLTKTFTLASETAGQIRVGYKSNGSGSGDNPMLFIDKVQIMYTAVTVKDNLAAALTYANRVNTGVSGALDTAIATAQAVYDNAAASQDDVDSATATLKTATANAIADSGLGDLTFVFQNGDFSSTDGWTPVISAQYRDYGNGLIGSALASYTASTVDDTHLATEYYLANQCRWSTNYSSFTQSALVLPAGNYTLKFDVMNSNSSTTATYENRYFVKVGETTYTDESTEWMQGATSWTAHTISFSLSAASAIEISLGYGTGSNNFGTANTPVLYTSHLKFNKMTEDEALAAAKEAWEEALQAAKDATNDGANDNVIGAEYVAISAEIAKAEPTTVEGYESATQALKDATSAFIAAAPVYDALVAEISKAAALGVDTSTAQDVADAETTTAATALAATQTLKVDEYSYVTTEFPYAVELGTWNAEGPTGTMTGQHWADGDGEYLEQSSAAWGQNAWTIKYSQDLTLPAGNYIFKVAGRKAAGNGVTMSLIVKNGETVLGTVSDFPEGDTGLGINTDGETDFDESHTYANNNAGRGWEWRYVKFTLSEQTTVNVAVEAIATTNYQWVSFCNATVQTDSEAGFALIDYNVALANAQTAQASTDYANVTGAEKTAIDAAIAADATLDKTDKDAIEAATQALKDATSAFTDAKTAYDALATAITEAEAVEAPTANVGEGVFQVPATAADDMAAAITAAKTTQSAAETTAETAQAAVATLQTAMAQATELNAPAAGQRFKLVLKAEGWGYDNKAITYKEGGRDDAGNYSISYADDVEAYEHSFTFTKVSGNNYKISQTDIDGNERYLSTGTPYGGNTSQIRTVTNADDAAEFTVIPTATEGIYNIYNVAAKNYVGSQDAGVYTVNSHIDFQLVEVQKVPVALTFTADVNYATRIFPFVPELPTGVKAYACESLDGTTLQLNEVAQPAANVPYILESESAIESSVEGWPLGKADTPTYTSGLLTGVYANTPAPVGSYVLQKLDSGVAFYVVEEGTEPTVTPYRAYLTAPAETGIKAINFPGADDATGISAIEALTDGTAEIFNAAGQRVPRLEKGVNIIRMSNGSVKKVFVK